MGKTWSWKSADTGKAISILNKKIWNIKPTLGGKNSAFTQSNSGKAALEIF